MKRKNLLFLAVVLSIAMLLFARLRADEKSGFQTVQFITLRWQGRDNSKVIRPNGKAEALRPLFEKFPRPDGLDERAYYLNIAINAFAVEGYDVAAMNNDEIIMRRFFR
jgi:hypothetical protein